MTYRRYIKTIHGTRVERMGVVSYPYVHHQTWRPLEKAQRKKRLPMDMAGEHYRNEGVLRNLAIELLTDEEINHFKQALHHFRVSRSVTSLCQHLKPIINSTEKILLLVELSSRIPKNLQEDFHRLCSLQYRNYETYYKLFAKGNSMTEIPKLIAQDSSGKFQIVSRGSEKKFVVNNQYKNAQELTSLPGTSVTSGVYSEDMTSLKILDDADDDKSDVFVWTPQYGQINASTSALLSSHNKNLKIKRIFLERRDDGSLGLGIQGGKEYGSEIYVCNVEVGGPAESQGLENGDKILEVNGTDFSDITHAEAVTLMRNAWNIIMMVQSLQGPRPNSTPQRPRSATTVGISRSDSLPMDDLEIIVFPTNGKLGCLTHRHERNKLLIVKGVDGDSPAEKAGLHTGDVIYKIDCIDIRTLSEKQIMSLTKSKRLILAVKRYMQNGGLLDSPLSPARTRTRTLSGSVFSPSDTSSPGKKSEMYDHPDHTHFDFNGVDTEESPERLAILNQHFDQLHNIYKDVVSPHNQKLSATVPGLVRRKSTDGNWLLSHQTQSSQRMIPKREFITAPIGHHQKKQENHLISRPAGQGHRVSRYDHHINQSEGYNQMMQFERRSRSHGRDYSQFVRGSGVMRYVRSRSQSPHTLRRLQRSQHHETDVMAAIQMGLEKRQRAIRLSLYQSPDQSDYEWEL